MSKSLVFSRYSTEPVHRFDGVSLIVKGIFAHAFFRIQYIFYEKTGRRVMFFVMGQ